MGCRSTRLPAQRQWKARGRAEPETERLGGRSCGGRRLGSDVNRYIDTIGWLIVVVPPVPIVHLATEMVSPPAINSLIRVDESGVDITIYLEGPPL